MPYLSDEDDAAGDVRLAVGVDGDGELRLADEAVDEHGAHNLRRGDLPRVDVLRGEQEAHAGLAAVRGVVLVRAVEPSRGDLAQRDAALDEAVRVVGAGSVHAGDERHGDGSVGTVLGPQPVATVLDEALTLEAEVHTDSSDVAGGYLPCFWRSRSAPADTVD